VRIVSTIKRIASPGSRIQPVVRNLLDDALLRPTCSAAAALYCNEALTRGAPSARNISAQIEREDTALPGVLADEFRRPTRLASSRLMASPSPVPAYFRLVPASAC